MVDETTLEQKRAQAKLYQGVTYDPRINKFIAMIMIRGERHYLGAFHTAGEASVVYDQTRDEHKIERAPRGLSGMSMKKALIAFEETARRDAKGVLVPDQILTAQDGQRFRVEGWRRREKHREYVWTSPCKICGVLFEQTTGMKLRNANGMTRTCKEHRGQLGKMTAHDWPDPEQWQTAPTLSAPATEPASSAGVKVKQKESGSLPDWAEGLRPNVLVFLREYLTRRPEATQEQFMRAFNEKLEREHRATLSPEEKEKVDADFDVKTTCIGTTEHAAALERQAKAYGRAANARLEDAEALAVDPKPDNSDLA